MRNELTMVRPPARLARLIATALVAAAALVAFPVSSPVSADNAATTRYVPVSPVRLADTRDSDCRCTRLDATTIRVQVAGVGGVPADATAAALNVTVADTVTTGFLTVWPAGAPRPWVSNLNWAGGTVPNGTIVTLGAGGAVDIFTNSPASVVVDVTGAFVPATSSAAGRYIPVAGGVTFDATVPGDSTADVNLSQWARGASAALITITGQAATPGFITAWPAGGARPWVSSMNAPGGDRVASNTVIVPVSSDGRISIYAMVTTGVTVSVHGVFTGAGALSTSTGLYVPTVPTRILDTREAGPTSGRPVTGGGTVAVDTLDAAAVNVNVTTVGTSTAGVWRATGTGAPFDSATGGTYTPGTAAAQAAIIAPTAAGVQVAPSTTTHVVVDLNGYFTGTVAASAAQPAPIAVPAAVVLAPAPRTGHPCETQAVAAIAAAYPQYRWLLDRVEFRIAGSLSYEGMAASGLTWPAGVSEATGWTFGSLIGTELTNRSCAGYVPAHEFGHAISDAAERITLARFGGGQQHPQLVAGLPAFSDPHAGCKLGYCPADEIFADCAARIVGATPAGRAHYTDCADPARQAAAADVLAADLTPAPTLAACQTTGRSVIPGFNPAMVVPQAVPATAAVAGVTAGLPAVLPAGTVLQRCTTVVAIAGVVWDAAGNLVVATPDGVSYAFDRVTGSWVAAA